MYIIINVWGVRVCTQNAKLLIKLKISAVAATWCAAQHKEAQTISYPLKFHEEENSGFKSWNLKI